MESHYKPAGQSTVSPYLIVDGADGTIGFLTRVFGAVAGLRKADASGRVKHAEVLIGDTVVMIADALPPAWPSVPSHVHIYVPDVDATYHAAIGAGASSVQEPVKRQDENRRAGVRDAGGTTWWIATKVD
jgi:uncharacterized glyoxalase superfamily protein PhnB